MTSTARRRLQFPVVPLGIVTAVTIPAVFVRFAGIHLDPLLGVLIFGAAIVSAAFALAWAGQAAEMDISGGLAIGLLAIIAILPEYAVDLYFAFSAGTDPSQAAYAAANMTGSNRLLLGFGWPFILLVAYLLYRVTRSARSAAVSSSQHQGNKLRDPDILKKPFAIRLAADKRVEIGLLLLASLVTLIIPLTGEIHLALGVFLLLIFTYYLYRVSREETAEPELVGVARSIGELAQKPRRITVILIFVLSAIVILLLAESFAESLVAGGKTLGIDDFLLVQWLAPLASEAPEFVIAIIFAFRGKSSMAIGMLLASKVNQWTALVGSLPIAHLLGGGGPALPLDGRQIEEFVLTAAQTFLGIGILLSLRFSARWAAILFVLFALTFVFTGQEARYAVSIVYAAVAVVLYITQWRQLWPTLKAPFLFEDSSSPEAGVETNRARPEHSNRGRSHPFPDAELLGSGHNGRTLEVTQDPVAYRPQQETSDP
ncbi:sodium:proton exchanger [Lysinibacter sp. HNR]|uniref:sodium:proton exchanger n=1 Tax=Lysinibacter sp. HNR TaxID=3031408 RepID=UPI0024361130|nr:sodium:proton exchanger [Lysinibacter sp. HNR]WGD38560.1 sodium:proton exchanger [Lysinibacter sp. HNR]